MGDARRLKVQPAEVRGSSNRHKQVRALPSLHISPAFHPDNDPVGSWFKADRFGAFHDRDAVPDHLIPDVEGQVLVFALQRLSPFDDDDFGS